MNMLERIKALNRPMLPEPTNMMARLPRLAGIKAVLFDIYGTLLTCGSGDVGTDAAGRAESAFYALREAGFCPAGPSAGERAVELLSCWIEKEHARMKANGIEYPEVDIRDIWKHVLRDLSLSGLISPEKNGSPEGAVIELLAVEYEGRVNPAWPMPDLKHTLEELRKQGLMLGIVSNAQFYTPLLFKALSETAWRAFDRRLCVLSYEVREAKPSTRIFKPVLDHLGDTRDCAPSETIFVGNDMLNDMMPAAHMGCKTALFAGDAKSLRLREGDERCARIMPDLVVASLAQLPEAVASAAVKDF